MSLASALGPSKKVRYGTVSLGDVAPTGNSEVTAFVTGNGREGPGKAAEGLADLRVIEGTWEAIRTGDEVTLPPFTRARRIEPNDQERKLRPRNPPEEVNASGPAKEE